MDYVSHVRFVDSHAKSDGRHHDIRLLAQKRFLVFDTLFARHSSVVGQGGKTQLTERRTSCFDLFSADTVDDSRLALVLADNLNQLVDARVSATNLKRQIRTIHRANQNLRVLLAKLGHNIVTNLGSCSRRISVNANVRMPLL